MSQLLYANPEQHKVSQNRWVSSPKHWSCVLPCASMCACVCILPVPSCSALFLHVASALSSKLAPQRLFVSPSNPTIWSQILLPSAVPTTEGRSTSTLRSFGPGPFYHKDPIESPAHEWFYHKLPVEIRNAFFCCSLKDRWLIKEWLPFQSCLT